MSIIDLLKWLYSNMLIINILLAILIVFFERKKPTSTWLWVMVLLFLPGIGFILYLFIGQNMRKKKLFNLKIEEDKLFKKMLHNQEKTLALQSHIFNDCTIDKYKDILHFHMISNEALYTEDNSVELFYNGEDKFNALKESLKNAQTYIHIEYYIIRNDHLGNEILDILCDKAKQGVEVKFLYDGMGGLKLPRKFFNPLIENGGEIACFFPPFIPYINLRINYRNHRKICIIDGKEAYIGGFNIGDEYLGKSKKFGFWRDTHSKICGSAVDSLQWCFLLDWRFASKQDISIDKKHFPDHYKCGDTGIQIVSSGPDSKWSNIKNGYFKMINSAREKVYITTPYFIPDDSMLEALRISALSGVDVRVIIPNKPDHPFVYWASLSYAGELLKAGVKFYTYDAGFVHSKLILIDTSICTLGTANLDIRSFDMDFEVNAFIYDRNVTKELEEKFIEDLDSCTRITTEYYENRSRIVKIKESISRLLSPIL